MEGVITAFTGTSLTLNVDTVGGSGSYASWNFSVAGFRRALQVSAQALRASPRTPRSAGSVTLAGNARRRERRHGLCVIYDGRSALRIGRDGVEQTRHRHE
jgi:hypothetical protein